MVLLGVVCWCTGAAGVELTFELPDNAKECFYEEIEKGTASSLEFQVGGAERIFTGLDDGSYISLSLFIYFFRLVQHLGDPDVGPLLVFCMFLV